MTRRRNAIIVGVAVGAMIAGAIVAGFISQRDSRAQGVAALLAISLPDINGREQPLAQWKGNVVIVNFWATWCAPCREEMPMFVTAQAQDASRGVQFVGIAVDDVAKVRQFAADINLNYPALIGGYGAMELSRTLGNSAMALPFTVVIRRDGTLAHTQLGPIKASQLDAILSELL